MGKGAKKAVFSILIIALLAILGFAGYRIYRSQKASETLRAEAEAAAQAAETEETEVTPTATPTPTETPVETVEETPTPTPEAEQTIMISFRGDVLDEDGTDASSGYIYMFEQLLKENGYNDIIVEDNTWENSGSLSQMLFAGVSEDEINAYVSAHTENGSEDIYDLVIRDDLADYQTEERDDQDAIPVITMGYYGGWNNNVDELVEQIQKVLATYSQQDKYIVIGVYPAAVTDGLVDAGAYDSAMEAAFGEHYLSMSAAGMDEAAFDDAGHQQIADALYAKMQELGYFDGAVVSDAGSSDEESAEEETSGDAEAEESTEEPTETEESADAAETDSASGSYSLTDGDGGSATISQNESGVYVDENGVTYEPAADGGWIDANGTYWAVN